MSVTRLFVGNLPGNVEEKELQSAFSAFGKIETVDLKSKSPTENNKFAFISLAASGVDVESCINHFSNEDFNGNRLYVTRARESFLERLQREREQARKSDEVKARKLPKKNPIIKLGDRLNPKKRKSHNLDTNNSTEKTKKQQKGEDIKIIHTQPRNAVSDNIHYLNSTNNKKYEAERKRMDSLKKKTREFKEKKLIIKNSLKGVDNMRNKKIIFNDNSDTPRETAVIRNNITSVNLNNLFDEDSDTDLNFGVKPQFEGKKGEKVLDLQSRYQSDKRFTLDERFIEEEEESDNEENKSENEEVELGHADEKVKQLNILQDILGVTIKTRSTETESKQTKPKLGMLRFDPMQPDHAKFLAPVEIKPDSNKKSKKKSKEKHENLKETQENEPDVPKVEVSKEQFYKISDTLKEAIVQPSSFSLRSLFGDNKNIDDGPQEQDTNFIPLETPKDKKKVKNPLDPTEKNPFVYDSSDSETEEINDEVKVEAPPIIETKAVWKENLFFSQSDLRLTEGLAFFTKAPENEVQKERRELKSLVKKRIYNKDRKNQMFKKKIGGRKKSMKKPYKTK